MSQPLEHSWPPLQPQNHAFAAYWQGKRAGDAPPPKAAIEPAEIPRLLPDLVIYERLAPDNFRIRLVGTGIVARVGMDPTGKNLLELMAYDSAERARVALGRVLDAPCAHVAVVRDQFASGREAFVELLRLPLTDKDSQPRFIVGCTVELRAMRHPPLEDQPVRLAQTVQDWFVALDAALPDEPAPAG